MSNPIASEIEPEMYQCKSCPFIANSFEESARHCNQTGHHLKPIVRPTSAPSGKGEMSAGLFQVVVSKWWAAARRGEITELPAPDPSRELFGWSVPLLLFIFAASLRQQLSDRDMQIHGEGGYVEQLSNLIPARNKWEMLCTHFGLVGKETCVAKIADRLEKAEKLLTEAQGKVSQLEASRKFSIVCFFCGGEIDRHDDDREMQLQKLAEHATDCEKHPLRKYVTQIAELTSQVSVLTANPKIADCSICGASIWAKEANISVVHGEYFHPICEVRQQVSVLTKERDDWEARHTDAVQGLSAQLDSLTVKRDDALSAVSEVVRTATAVIPLLPNSNTYSPSRGAILEEFRTALTNYEKAQKNIPE